MRERIQQVSRAIRRSLVLVGVTALLSLSPLAVHADNYGNGAYGSDVYGSSTTPSSGSSGSSSSSGSPSAASSSPTSESTVIQTPSGLEVAINLSDGQAIPSTGYYITITPINGEGKTFDKAEIYLDGQLAFSGAPDSTGTLKWLWDTAKNPATKVKIIVYGPGSGTTTHEFNVTVAPVEATTSNNQNKNAETSNSNPSTSGVNLPMVLIWSSVGLLLLVLVIWLIARRRRRRNQTPPTVFPPMQ